MYNSKINIGVFVLLISISWFIISFVYNVDTLGGALHDFKMHEKYFFYFSENFIKTLSEYGENNEVRNSPVFYILYSKLIQIGIDTANIKYFNLIVIIPIIFFFNKCLDLKFDNIDKNTRFFFISCIFLSPTVSSLITFPYPIIWAFCFFLISVFYFLKFREIKEYKILNSLMTVLNLSVASYFTPNFAVFIIFFFYYFILNFGISKNLLILVIFSFLLSLPAFTFLFWKDFYMFKNNVFEVTFFEKINFSNKIIIITSFIIFFFIPFFKITGSSLNSFKEKIKSKNFFLLISLTILCVFYFDFRNGAGGGFIYKFSIIFFKNNFFILFIFVLSILYFYFYNLLNFNNVFIFVILILYNLQYSIYYKYFDPLLFIIFLFLIKINSNNLFNLNQISKKYFLFYLLFLLMNIFKNNFLKILTV